MPWRDAVSPRAVKALGALAASMTLGAALLMWVEPAMERYQPNSDPLEPPQLRLSAQSNWDCIYVAATMAANNRRVPCHFWVPRHGKWQRGMQPLDVPVRSESWRVLRIGVEPGPRGSELTDSQRTQMDYLLEFASGLGIPRELVKPDPYFHPGHRAITCLMAQPK